MILTKPAHPAVGGTPRLLRISDVRSMTGLSRSYIYSLTKNGHFPKSVPLVPGGIAKGWVESEVQDFINQRIAERDLEASNA
ncbi:AlpA family phage regulatory protein [uncultured Pseudoteredinibacter sp.]|uniref:helix-turn-helix transcriptional regulator n=1 Tax=uncultured Pseudoteredinibacter sp. TaxID=1641701 RepID=UPI00262CC14D|nr:AlpA family phage regulatory protein [uncultured Pseudoteredinibacter sp.]